MLFFGGEEVSETQAEPIELSDNPPEAERCEKCNMPTPLEALRELVEAAEAFLARWIDGRSPALVRALMEALRNARRLPRDEALRRETDLFLRVAREART